MLFRLRNIRLIDKDGSIVAQAPLAAIGMSGAALLLRAASRREASTSSARACCCSIIPTRASPELPAARRRRERDADPRLAAG